jgi:hypothetical protein
MNCDLPRIWKEKTGRILFCLFDLLSKIYEVKVQVKVKFTLEQATKTQRGSRDIALLFPEPRPLMGVGGQRHAQAVLPPGKDPVPIL